MSALLQPLVPPVVLLGPPGAGKSTVGPRVAALLGFSFVDLDDVTGVEHLQREGLASFRVREHLALREAVERGAVVIAAGAGVVDTGPSRELLARCCCVVVDVDADVALARLTGQRERPWLPPVGDPGRAAAWREREHGRAAHRAAVCIGGAGSVVDGRAPVDDVAAAVVAVVTGYVLQLDGDDDDGPVPDGFLIADAAVDDAHNAAVLGRPPDLVIDINPAQKRLALVEEVLGHLVAAGVTRSDVVAAVGGGLLLDVVGLAAALHHRGTPWHAVPTTLLAMVDASIGGKTAVDVLVEGARGPRDDVLVRNAAGAFHPPRGTTVDLRYLATLPPDALRHGRAEMVKHALLGGFAPPRTGVAVDDDDVRRSRRFKRAVVGRDPRERHLRHALNLGHTFAHAFESRFGFAHGDAVWHGLDRALALSVDVAGLDAAVADDARAQVHAHLADGAPRLSIGADDVDALLLAMSRDKKSERGATRFVLLRAPGQPVLAVVDDDAVRACLRKPTPWWVRDRA